MTKRLTSAELQARKDERDARRKGERGGIASKEFGRLSRQARERARWAVCQDHMDEYRCERNAEVGRGVARNTALSRAMTVVQHRYPDEFRRALAQAKADRGLGDSARSSVEVVAKSTGRSWTECVRCGMSASRVSLDAEGFCPDCSEGSE